MRSQIHDRRTGIHGDHLTAADLPNGEKCDLLFGLRIESAAYVDRSFGVDTANLHRAAVNGGAFEPSGLLPMQFPSDMKTVEEQFEDTPHDMKCHVDTDGNAYDFAFGMNWSGTIEDSRVKKYRK